MQYSNLIYAILLSTSISCFAINIAVTNNPNFTVDLYGYTKLDAFWDNQQMIGFRDDQFFISPEPTKNTDNNNRSSNEQGQFHFTAIESRIGMWAINNDWIESARSQGRIEVDFFGITEATTASARLRHAYAEIKEDDNYSILFGQSWNPLFIASCYPNTLGFDYGAPAEFQSRGAQVRFTKYHNNVAYMFTMASQESPFLSDGPNGFSTEYIRQSKMPEFNWCIDIPFDDNLVGASVGVKRLVPRIETDEDIPTDNSVTSAVAEIYAGFNREDISLCTKIFYAQNETEHVILGGYGITSRNTETNIQTYDTIDAVGGWIDGDLALRNNWNCGLLISGVTKCNERCFVIDPDQHTRFATLPDADSVVRISPRVYWEHDNVKAGLEVSVVHTKFGTPDNNGKLTNLFSETGVRTLFVGYYFF